MTEPEATAAQARTASVGRWLCLAGGLIGAAGLLDAIGRTGLLTSLVPAEPSMTANTGLALLFLGGAGVLRDQQDDAGAGRKTLSLLATLVVLAIGLATIVEHAIGIDLHIDQLIARGTDPVPHPGRPAPATALALACLAGALVVFDFRARARARPSEWLILAGGLVALTVLLGYVFGAVLGHRLTRAPLIGAAFPHGDRVAADVGGLAARTSRGGADVRGDVVLVRVACSSAASCYRRCWCPSPSASWSRSRCAKWRTEALVVALAVLAAAMGVMGLLVLLGLAMSLNRTYEALEASRAGARTLVEQAPDAVFVADIAGRYTDVNDAGCRMLGYTRDEILAMTIVDLLAPEDVGRLSQQREQLLEGDIKVGEWTLCRKDGVRVPGRDQHEDLPRRTMARPGARHQSAQAPGGRAARGGGRAEVPGRLRIGADVDDRRSRDG